MKIAISGKGGVGKTTISANLAKMFVQRGYNVYAVDADPDSSLGLALGIDDDALENIKPLIEMKDFIGEKVGEGAFFTLNPLVNDVVEKFSEKINGINFLKMGGIKKGGSECYCRENTFLKSVVNSLLLDIKDIVILDMGAGIEHLTRGTSSGVDLMLIITESGKSSVQTARVVENLSKELRIEQIKFIANKIRTENEAKFIKDNFNDSELAGIIHYDEPISERSMGIIENSKFVDNKEIESVLSQIVFTIK